MSMKCYFIAVGLWLCGVAAIAQGVQAQDAPALSVEAALYRQLYQERTDQLVQAAAARIKAEAEVKRLQAELDRLKPPPPEAPQKEPPP